MSADGLAAIGTGEEGAGARVRLDLVRLPLPSVPSSTLHCITLILSKKVETYHQDANVELLGHVRQLRQVLIQFLLSVRQLAATAVVDAETGHDAVDYQEAVFIAREGGGERVEEFELVLV